MGVLLFYIIATLPLLFGGILFIFSNKVNWKEWIINSAVVFLLAAMTHAIAIHGMTADTETWSGQITQSREYSAWQEYYEYAVYRTEFYTEMETRTDSDGHSHSELVMKSRQVFDHWEPTTRWHDIHWNCSSNINTSYTITGDHHHYLEKKFNDRHIVQGDRVTGEHNSRMIGGDSNDYYADNKTGWVEPVTKPMSFTNKVKAAPSVFSFVKPPKGKVFDYPKNEEPFVSDRLLGSAVLIDKLSFDQMNARLGPTKKVNVIIVGFGDKGSDYGQMQQAEWVGGKKNDVVITFGGNNKKPDWVFVFGWTEKDVTKRDLESIVMNHGAVTETLPLIEKEVRTNYVIKDWKKFDYLKIEPPTWSYVVFTLVIVLGQGGFWYWVFTNDFSKNVKRRFDSYRGY